MTAAAPVPARPTPWGRILLTLVIGGCGGGVFSALNLPLPWMLGALTFCVVAALRTLPLASTARFRPAMSAVIGVFVGSGFSPEVLGQIGSWLPNIAVLLVYIVVAGAAAVLYLIKVEGVDPTTAYFCGMPGGVYELVLQGSAMGGDEKTIALLHSGRIMVIVLVVPFAFQYLGGVNIGPRTQFGLSLLDTPLADMAILVACAGVGWALATLLRLPAADLTGPMLVSATAHLAGLTRALPPSEILSLAQVVLGCSIGSRFIGVAPRAVLNALRQSLFTVGIMLAATVLFAFFGHLLFAIPVSQGILALAPGGMTEMSLIAIALGADVTFITLHQLVRISTVAFGAALVFKLLRR